MSKDSPIPVVRSCQLRGAVPVLTLVVVGLTLLVAVVIGYWTFAGSPEDLLKLQTLTPKQVREVATKLLLHDDPRIRGQASEKLAKQGDAAVPVLKDVGLTQSDPRLRLAVFEILALLAPEAAADVLEDMMNDSDRKIRRRAVGGASRLKHPRGVALLTKALSDPDAGIRSAAAGAFSMIGDQSAVPALKQALNDPDPSVRRHAARALRDITGEDYSITPRK